MTTPDLSPAPMDLGVVFSPEWLGSVLGRSFPGVVVAEAREVWRLESTATKVRFEVEYANQGFLQVHGANYLMHWLTRVALQDPKFKNIMELLSMGRFVYNSRHNFRVSSLFTVWHLLKTPLQIYRTTLRTTSRKCSRAACFRTSSSPSCPRWPSRPRRSGR